MFLKWKSSMINITTTEVGKNKLFQLSMFTVYVWISKPLAIIGKMAWHLHDITI